MSTMYVVSDTPWGIKLERQIPTNILIAELLRRWAEESRTATPMRLAHLRGAAEAVKRVCQ